MSTLAIVLRNEGIKISRRLAFWVTIVVYSGICTLMSTVIMRSIRKSPDPPSGMLPHWWARTLGEAMPLALFMTAAIVVLLVASEFSWRTARQNVIDGLSKEAWFLGKLLNLPIVSLSLLACALLILGGFGIAATDFAREGVVFARAADLRFMAVFVLGTLAFGALALLFAVSVRSAGPALAAFFLYFLIDQFAAQLIKAFGNGWAYLGAYLPGQLLTRTADVRQWYPALRSPGAIYMDENRLIGFAVVYTAVLVLASFLIVRKRDL